MLTLRWELTSGTALFEMSLQMRTIPIAAITTLIALTTPAFADAYPAGPKGDEWHFKGLPRCVATAPVFAPCQSALPLTQQAKSLAPNGLSVSAHGDALDVIYRGSNGSFAFGDAPYLGGDLQTYLEGGEDGFWSARITVPNLARAVIEAWVANISQPPQRLTFLGEHADHVSVHPGRPANIARRETLHSKILPGDRDIYIFRGRRCEVSPKNCTLVVLADGESLDTFLDNTPLKASGLLDDFIFIGVTSPPSDDGQMRIAELLLAYGQPEFPRFEAFVLNEVIPHVEGGAAPAKARWTAGYSNGGAWAVDMALRHPTIFTGALGFSIGGTWTTPERTPSPGPTFLLGAGTLEPSGFGKNIRLVAGKLSALGLPVQERHFTGGHSTSTWNALFWSYLPLVASKGG